MIEVIKTQYWSKSEAFLLPLTGLSKSQKYPVKSYLFWEDYSIDNYNLILLIKYNDYEEFNEYFKKTMLPILSKNGLMEVFDVDNQTILIVDLSIWGFDIDMFLAGKYSKMSGDAFTRVKEYHRSYSDGALRLELHIRAALYPNKKDPSLGDKSPIEYVCENYGFDMTELQKIGEMASTYDQTEETLTGINCQDSILL